MATFPRTTTTTTTTTTSTSLLFLSPRATSEPPAPPALLPFPAKPTNNRPTILKSFNHGTRTIRIPFSSFRNNSTPPETECPVPLDQQPINEYQALSTSFPFSWASADLVEYCSRLFTTGLSVALFVGLPVSWYGSVGSDIGPQTRALGAVSFGLFVVTLSVVRMYLGWAYVGNRLLSATVEYEETGWYDGQVWVKTAEVLARDRLLGSFSVKPVLGRLKNTLVVLATSLFVCVLVLVNTDSSKKVPYITSEEAGGRSIPGVYNDESARSFEPDAFCGESVAPD